MSNTVIAEYGRTRDGILVARIGYQAFAMMPAENGFHLVKAWGLSGALTDWTAADFHGGRDDKVDEAGFREVVEQRVLHHHQLALLDRHSIAARRATRWGSSQHAVAYGPGIVSHQTAGHGGFELSSERNAQVHPLLRSCDGWYEEDCAWCAVAIAFPAFFTDLERRTADDILKQVYPDAWEEIHNATLEHGQSRVKDRRAFDTENAERWVVIAAILSTQNSGFVECIATLGGHRGGPATGEGLLPVERRFLVLEERYDIGLFGFVIDEDRDVSYDGPSSFAGWAGR
ncbi:hypothetical protein DEM27_24315 [Metarhizobium album]|uniref:DUF7007 domain-containing protein n=1 Tax=Metarhizobium album TaxID=2182425 RepID=A0A2U2DK38_9HYPH|nr:hypothetical protein [Rhizobium album]PWE53672.1 hypothetical protein DEM27_24315 [Rhizobium album]